MGESRSGLILSGASCTDLKIGVWRRRTYQKGNLPLVPLVSMAQTP